MCAEEMDEGKWIWVFHAKGTARPQSQRQAKNGTYKNSKAILNGLFGIQEDIPGELKEEKQTVQR